MLKKVINKKIRENLYMLYERNLMLKNLELSKEFEIHLVYQGSTKSPVKLYNNWINLEFLTSLIRKRSIQLKLFNKHNDKLLNFVIFNLDYLSNINIYNFPHCIFMKIFFYYLLVKLVTIENSLLTATNIERICKILSKE